MEYFSIITQDHWTYKNNAQKEAHEVGKDMSRRIIEFNEVDEFINEFEAKISIVNKNNKRCKDLKLAWWYPSSEEETKNDIEFIIPNVFHLSLYKAKQRFVRAN